MSDLIGISVEEIPHGIRDRLKKLPDDVSFYVTAAAGEYLAKKFEKPPGYRYVSRAAAYPDAPAGPGWFSDRQRRWFFAALRRGAISIPYVRTGTLEGNWKVMPFGSRDHIVVNDTPYAGFVMGDQEQSRHEGMAGWKKLQSIVSENLHGLRTSIGIATKKAIKMSGLM